MIINGKYDFIYAYKESIYQTIYCKINNKAIAEDILQDTFVKIISALDNGFYIEEGKFSGWANTIAVHTCFDHFRKLNKLKTVPFADFRSYDISDEDVNEKEEQETLKFINKMVVKLPFEQQEILALRYNDGLSFKDIAKIKKFSINTGTGRMRYAISNLKKMLLILLITLFTGGCMPRQTFTPIAGRNNVTGGTDSAKWVMNSENDIRRFYVEYGRDTFHFKTLSPAIKPGKLIYTYPLPDSSGFVRIRADGTQDFYTQPLLHKTNTSTITSPVYKSTSLTWTVTAEKSVSYYLIEKSLDGKTWSQTTKVTAKGKPGVYSYRLSRTTKKYTYRITAVFKDGTKGQVLIFK